MITWSKSECRLDPVETPYWAKKKKERERDKSSAWSELDKETISNNNNPNVKHTYREQLMSQTQKILRRIDLLLGI